MKISLKILMLIFAILPMSFFMSACSEEELNTFSGITFSAVSVDYDGEEHTILLNGNLPEGTVVEYSNNSGTNAGEYNASVTLSLEGYKSITLTAKLTINKINYDMSNAHWSYQSAFTYNGSNREVTVVGLPQGVTVASYQNNSKTNAGNYTASVTFNYDTVNHNAPTMPNLSWKINKATYDMTNAVWSYDSQNPFIYNGTAQVVEVQGLPQGVTVASYQNNSKTNAGNYTASVTFNYDTVNHNVPAMPNLSWKINKATYDMSNAHWSQSSFIYNGSNKEVVIVGLPQGVTVASYQNNVNSEVGKYIASVIFNYDTINYNPVVLEPLVWRILPDIDLTNFASSVINSLMNVPDPWEFLPESFSIENKAYTGSTEIDYTSFVSVPSLPQVAIGKQMNVVYSTLIDFDNALGYVRDVYGYLNVIVNLYQTFINDTPENYANYEKQTENFTFKIVINNNNYEMYISYKSVAIELSYQSENQKCYGRIQLTDSNVIKYEMADDDLTVATEVLGVALAILHFERNNNVVAGYLYEYYGTEAHNIKTSALIKVDSTYTSIISNKRETDDLLIEGYMEVYKNSTGKLVGAEVRETVSSIKYETSWFNLWDVQGINTIKVEDATNGTNADTIYINGSANAIKTKLVGGLSGRSLSRRFDIEMKDMFVYKYNTTEEKYEKVKIQIPMLFIQNDFISSFSDDFWSKNEDTGAINPTTLSLQTQDKNYLLSKYATLIDAYVELKEGMTYATIKSYIGIKNQYFN